MTNNLEFVMRIIRLSEVLLFTGLARSTVYRYIEKGIFPKPVSLGDRAVGWVDEEVQAWVMDRVGERDRGEEFKVF